MFDGGGWDLEETNGRAGDWLMARSTHLDQLDQLISPKRDLGRINGRDLC